MKLTRKNEITISIGCTPLEFFRLKGFTNDADIKYYAANIFKSEVKLPKTITLVGADIAQNETRILRCNIVDQNNEHMGIVSFVNPLLI